MKDRVKIRLLKKRDISSLLTFYTKQRDYPKKPRDYDYDGTELELYRKSDHCHILVAILGNKVVGYSIFYDLLTWGYIDELCVHKDYRNRHIGTTMFNWIEDKYREKWTCVEMAALVEDKEMIFYMSKLGFGCEKGLVWKSKGLKGARYE